MPIRKKYFLSAFIIFLLGCAILFSQFFVSNTGNFVARKYLYIKTGTTYSEFIKVVRDSGIVKNINSFKRVGRVLNLQAHIHPGRYEILSGMGNYKLVSLIKKGRQSPVNLVIHKLRTRRDIIRKFSSQLEPDSAQWEALFANQIFLKKHGIDSFQIQHLIIPNTYQFYWNSTAENIIQKIISYQNRFWNEERIRKAKALNLTPVQVTIIASIVEEETNKNDEKPIIASVYLNRYKIGMKLGADPTVKFATGDFGLRRILNKHTQIESPYNTYKYSGLPPGPICTPSEKSIDAVLNPAITTYLFFCAKEDFSGYHNFATNYAGHLINAGKYQQALNKRGIK